MSKRVRTTLDDKIEELDSIRNQYAALRKEIKKAESLGRRDKRSAVAELFKSLLENVFGDKYTFDGESFSILLGQDALATDAARVLSDGEKTVVAFCYYVASTYERLSFDDDAQKLFFVIDDPISSLDYHYVYSVAQIVKSLGSRFNISGRNLRFFVLTHNSAFFNILCRNNIVDGRFAMYQGKIEKADQGGVAQYYDHLKDIYSVSHGGDIPHTTGNSIRQVLEAIWHFDAPNYGNLSEYLINSDFPELHGNDFIYLLCNDQSHGASAMDLDPPIDEDGVRRACEAVLRLIKRRFPGQLKVATITLDG